MAGGLWNDYYCGAIYNYICGPGNQKIIDILIFIRIHLCFEIEYNNNIYPYQIASQEWCEFISEYECNDEYVKIHCPKTCSSKSELYF